MNNELSLLTLVQQASIVVQVVLAGLALTSLASWAAIFGKLFGLRRVRGGNDEFEREFWSGRNLGEMNQAVGSKPTRRRWSASSPAACASS